MRGSFAFPCCLMMLNVFSYACVPCVCSFGERSVSSCLSPSFLLDCFFSLLSFQISLDILDTSPLSEIYVCKCFLPVYSLTFQTLNGAFHRVKVLDFYQPHLPLNYF